MDITTIAIGFACAVGLIMIIINVFKKRNIDQFLESNTDVPQLYLQKTVENKLRTLQHALRQTITETTDDPMLNRINADRLKIAKELSTLKETYKQKKISLKGYNHKLDILLQKLDETIVI